MNKTALAIHGGAGTILKSQMTAELEREYRERSAKRSASRLGNFEKRRNCD